MDLCDALRQAVREQGRETRPGRARSLPEVVDAFGGQYGLVSWMAGTSVRSSTAYRSASRRLQRWRQGSRRPPGPALRQLRQEATRRESKRRRDDRREYLAQNGTYARIQADVMVSNRNDVRHRRVNGDFLPEYWPRIIAALDAGDCEAAEDLFAEGFGIANRMPGLEFDDVDFLEVG